MARIPGPQARIEADRKMTAPRYQEFGPERIPEARPAPGVAIKVIAGQVGEVRGPIQQSATEPIYLDVHLDADAAKPSPVPIPFRFRLHRLVPHKNTTGAGPAGHGSWTLRPFGSAR